MFLNLFLSIHSYRKKNNNLKTTKIIINLVDLLNDI